MICGVFFFVEKTVSNTDGFSASAPVGTLMLSFRKRANVSGRSLCKNHFIIAFFFPGRGNVSTATFTKELRN